MLLISFFLQATKPPIARTHAGRWQDSAPRRGSERRVYPFEKLSNSGSQRGRRCFSIYNRRRASYETNETDQFRHGERCLLLCCAEEVRAMQWPAGPRGAPLLQEPYLVVPNWKNRGQLSADHFVCRGKNLDESWLKSCVFFFPFLSFSQAPRPMALLEHMLCVEDEYQEDRCALFLNITSGA